MPKNKISTRNMPIKINSFRDNIVGPGNIVDVIIVVI